MEITKPEVAAVLAVVNKMEDAVVDLNDLQLVMVGGGVGDVILV